MKRVKRFTAALAALSAAACSGPLTTVAPAPPAAYELTKPTQAWACGLLLFGYIPIGVNDRARVAYERARSAIGATGLTDVKISDRWTFVVIGFKLCTKVEGTGFRAPRTAGG